MIILTIPNKGITNLYLNIQYNEMAYYISFVKWEWTELPIITKEYLQC